MENLISSEDLDISVGDAGASAGAGAAETGGPKAKMTGGSLAIGKAPLLKSLDPTEIRTFLMDVARYKAGSDLWWNSNQ